MRFHAKVAAMAAVAAVAWLWCGSLQGQTNYHAGVKNAPPVKIGSIQWQMNQDAARKQQELYRLRIPLPAAAFGSNVPRYNGMLPVMPNNGSSTVAVMAPPAPPMGRFTKFTIFLLIFFLAMLGVAKIFAPNFLARLNRRYSPRMPAFAGGLKENVRAEEDVFDEFLEKFRVGPHQMKEAGEPEKPLVAFYARAAKSLVEQRRLWLEIHLTADDAARQKLFVNLLLEMGGLKSDAIFPEVLPVWQVISVLEGLLKHLIGKLGNVNPSTLETLSGGLDLLDKMCVPGLDLDVLVRSPLKFLVVDDDLISRQAMSLALKKAFGEPDLAVDGESALAKAGEIAYDVIFLDVQMPGMDGFELCTKIRATEANRGAPVIFVTNQSDFEARHKSTLSGGNDLMGKPFLIFEITIKALTQAYRGRMEKQLVAAVPASSRAVPAAATEEAASPDTMQVSRLRDFCRILRETQDKAARQNLLADALLRVTAMISQNPANTRHPTTQICTALEGLFKKMLQDAKHSTPSAVATVAAAVDLLFELSESAPNDGPPLNSTPFKILVVDDDLVTRRIMVGALQTFFTRPESVENGEEAVIKVAEKTYDLIFLDVMMPGMDGFETCHKIRETSGNKSTPVVFVTSNDDFETRSRASELHGNELMGKPFLIAEIMVKALTLALRSRMQKRELVV